MKAEDLIIELRKLDPLTDIVTIDCVGLPRDFELKAAMHDMWAKYPQATTKVVSPIFEEVG